MKGHIAQRYGDLVKDLWSGTAKSIAPLKLRVSQHYASNILCWLVNPHCNILNNFKTKQNKKIKN